ncbi:MAG: glutamate--tRNA ligase family protein, partial [Ilumatobacteraceae bacterium]
VDDAAYPGTCRDLSPAERAARRATRPPAVRLRSTGESVTIDDALAGPFTGVADDVVLRRNDGVPAYNLAVVVDDGAQGITEVVRGDDLVPSTPSQILLQRLLGLPEPRYVHVPLVVGGDGRRLAKRHGAVTLDDLVGQGVPAGRVVAALGASLGVHGAVPAQMLDDFDLAAVCAVGRDPVALGDLEQAWG